MNPKDPKKTRFNSNNPTQAFRVQILNKIILVNNTNPIMERLANLFRKIGFRNAIPKPSRKVKRLPWSKIDVPVLKSALGADPDSISIWSKEDLKLDMMLPEKTFEELELKFTKEELDFSDGAVDLNRSNSAPIIKTQQSVKNWKIFWLLRYEILKC